MSQPQKQQARHTLQTSKLDRRRRYFSPPGDLWKRIRAGIRFNGNQRDEVLAASDSYLSTPQHINKVASNARPYLYLVAEEVKKRGLPMDLVLLPFVESAYQPEKVSNFDAAGLWQIIPSTAQSLGLQQDEWYDARQDILASTRAALDYLQSLHELFEDDWLIALAAYNCGRACLIQAIHRNQEKGKPTDFWSLDLPPQTRRYVPKFLAISSILKSPEDFGIVMHRLPDAPFLTTMPHQGNTSVITIAGRAGLSTRELLHYNPGFKRLYLGHIDTPWVLVPTHNRRLLKKLRGNAVASLRTWRNGNPNAGR